MKKMILTSSIAAALGAALPSDANAAFHVPISSNITNMQLWLTDGNIINQQPGYPSHLEFSGQGTDADEDGYLDSANINLFGEVNVYANDINIRLDFGLTNGGYVQGSGITFTGGNIHIDIESTEGWLFYGVIDASLTNIGLLANQPGHMTDYGLQHTTAGIVRNTLPGLWDGVVGSPSFDRAAGSLNLLGFDLGLFLEGELYTGFPDEPGYATFGPPEVPIPAAAWLFGTGLAGLAVAGRRRRS